jgi:hypothetical protein
VISTVVCNYGYYLVPLVPCFFAGNELAGRMRRAWRYVSCFVELGARVGWGGRTAECWPSSLLLLFGAASRVGLVKRRVPRAAAGESRLHERSKGRQVSSSGGGLSTGYETRDLLM